MNSKANRESQELDKSQMDDLRKFLSSRTPQQLAKDLKQTVEDAEADKGPYISGGTPANVTKTFIAIQNELDKS